MRERSLLVVVQQKDRPRRGVGESLEELRELTDSAGGDVIASVTALIERPDPAYYIRRGKLEEIKEKREKLKGDLLIFNVDLSAVQTRNIEREAGVRVVDRTGLILDIFARRAQTHEGRIQVELAQLLYLMPRLTGRGILLSRLGGGIGTRGPGEQKLEIDRRRIREQILRLRKELEKIRTHRKLIRTGRKRKDFPVVAIVGYTNSGKSSLLNALTGAHVLVGDKLFATLDPTTRIFRRGHQELLFTDTVGFLVDLPPNLIEAFQATLEEIYDADMILHVLDAAHPQSDQQFRAVQEILTVLQVNGKPQVLALNKTDLLGSEEAKRAQERHPEGVPISAKLRQGLETLVTKVGSTLSQHAN